VDEDGVKSWRHRAAKRRFKYEKNLGMFECFKKRLENAIFEK